MDHHFSIHTAWLLLHWCDRWDHVYERVRERERERERESPLSYICTHLSLPAFFLFVFKLLQWHEHAICTNSIALRCAHVHHMHTRKNNKKYPTFLVLLILYTNIVTCIDNCEIWLPGLLTHCVYLMQN